MQCCDSEIVLQRHLNNLMGELKELIPFFEKESVNNIFILWNGTVKVEDFYKGRYDAELTFPPDKVRRIINFVAYMQDRQINEKKLPTLETTIPQYNFRLSAVVPPWTSVPELTIRRPSGIIFSLEDWVEQGNLSQENYNIIVEAIKEQQNIVISGATSSGKTTFLNSCLKKQAELFPDDRYLIIEDTPELSCPAENRSCWLIEKHQAVEAVEFVLRFTPNHISFGEVRKAAVLEELIDAWLTHKGNFTTFHGHTADAAIKRMETMVKDESMRLLIREVIHLCVHLTKKKVDEILIINQIEQMEVQRHLYKGLYDQTNRKRAKKMDAISTKSRKVM